MSSVTAPKPPVYLSCQIPSSSSDTITILLILCQRASCTYLNTPLYVRDGPVWLNGMTSDHPERLVPMLTLLDKYKYKYI